MRICAKSLTSGRKGAEFVQNKTANSYLDVYVGNSARWGEHICSDLLSPDLLRSQLSLVRPAICAELRASVNTARTRSWSTGNRNEAVQ